MSAPTAVTVKAGDKCATVSFTAPTPLSGRTISNYTVVSNPGGVVATGTSSPIVIGNLTNGTSYTFTVTVTYDNNSTAISTASASVKINPQHSVLRGFFYFFLALVLIGALNWGLVSVNKDYDLVKMLLGDYTMYSRSVYGLVGISALLVIVLSAASMSSIYSTN
jgi:uncharacterized membrane protein YuzA (DUF378 family)